MRPCLNRLSRNPSRNLPAKDLRRFLIWQPARIQTGNGHEISASEVDTVINMPGVAKGSIGEKPLADWLKANHQKVK